MICKYIYIYIYIFIYIYTYTHTYIHTYKSFTVVIKLAHGPISASPCEAAQLKAIFQETFGG